MSTDLSHFQPFHKFSCISILSETLIRLIKVEVRKTSLPQNSKAAPLSVWRGRIAPWGSPEGGPGPVRVVGQGPVEHDGGRGPPGDEQVRALGDDADGGPGSHLHAHAVVGVHDAASHLHLYADDRGRHRAGCSPQHQRETGEPPPCPCASPEPTTGFGCSTGRRAFNPNSHLCDHKRPRPAGGRLRGRYQASPSRASAASGVLGPAHSRASEAGAHGPPNPLRPQFPCCWVLVTCLCLSPVFSPQTCYGLRKTQTCVRVRSSRP